MKEKVLIRICAGLLTACVAVSSVTAFQIIRVYATDDGGGGFDYVDNEDPVENPDVPQEDYGDPVPAPDPTPAPDPEPDPFDYDLDCYTPNINFGTADYGDVIPAKQFTVVNTGKNRFPLTWEEMDPYTAFDIGTITNSMDIAPGESVIFSVSPRENIGPGTYTASYTFFSANDYRRHHTARVDVSVTIKDSTPYITSVEITPSSVTLPTGKSYRFGATVRGGNGYDPTVIWSVTGNQSAETTIDSDGNLYISARDLATSFAVVATSREDPDYLDRAVVTVSNVDYTVRVSADPYNGGVVTGGGAVRSGGNATVTCSPNNNFEFLGWYQNGNLLSSSYQFTYNNITSDVDLVAKFARRTCFVRTSVNNGDAGGITQSTSVPYGGKMSIFVSVNEGYHFAGFVENKTIIGTTSPLELTNITSDRDIMAVFTKETCKVNVSVYPQDTGKYEGAGEYAKGKRVQLTASPYDGYEFAGWSINGQIVSRDTVYTIGEINSDVNVVANFMKKNATTYKLVSGIANQGGNIVPSGDYYVQEGGSVTYNIVPLSDYNITAVIVDGKNIGPVSSYTFNNVRGGHTITASFEKKPQQPAPAQQPANKTDPSKTAPSGGSQPAPVYNADTAASGAMPEQNIIETEIPDETSPLEGEQYEDDIITPYQETVVVDTPVSSGVMAKHNMDEDTLRILIDDDAVLPMLREAYEDGTLQITVNNSYAEHKQETSTAVYFERPTLLNFEDVIAETLSKDEKFDVLTGTPISFNIDITDNTDTVDEGTKRLMCNKIGYKPVRYFDFRILKTAGGDTTVINTTASELEVVLPIPEELRKEGRKFYILRNHNGDVDILDDISVYPDIISFKTDRFSEYAIAYEAVNINRLILRFAIVTVVALILAVICFVSLVKYKRKERRNR